MSKKFKIAVLIGSYNIEKWKYKLLNDLENSGIADLQLFLEPAREDNPPFLYKLYEKGDREFFYASAAFKEFPGEENALEVVEFSRQSRENGREFDLVLNLTQEKYPEKIPKTRYGVWFFSFGKEKGFLKAPYLRELYENNPVSECSLRALVDGEEKVLYTSYSSTNLFSLYINRNKNYWKASEFVLRCLK